MPVIPVGYAQVTHIFGGTNCPRGAAVVYGVFNEDLESANDVAAQCGTSFANEVLPLLTSDVTLVRTDVKLGPNETGMIGTSTTGSGPGEQSNNSEAPGICYLVTKSSGVGGRRGRGRMFLPGVDGDNTSDAGIVDVALVGNLQTAMTSFLAALQTANLGMHLLHDFAYTWVINDNGQPRRVPVDDAPPFPNVVTSMSVSNKVATQRRRLR